VLCLACVRSRSVKAVVYDRYGPPEVLRIADVADPKIPAGGVLVRVTRAALNPKDALTRRGRFRRISGSRFPKRCGMDLAGFVVESRSPRFAPGQRVFGFLTEVRYLRGSLAERVACTANELAAIPAGVSDEDAAATALVGLSALQAFRDKARIVPGQRVLINGAAGGVGTVAIQIGRLLGAVVHTVSSEANRALCSELGAHQTWSYPEHGWKREPPFDVIFDVFGNLVFRDVRAQLARRGRFVSTVPSPRRFLREVTSRFASQEERLIVVRPRREDFETLARWLAEKKVRAVIDGRHSLEHLQEAFARLESKRTRGKIVIEIA
jgi:NADPH:quinone reductase-like Zn-dependent oxidoreductase